MWHQPTLRTAAGAPLRRFLDRRINIEERIKGPVRLDMQIFGGSGSGTKQETLQVSTRKAQLPYTPLYPHGIDEPFIACRTLLPTQTKGVRHLLQLKSKECDGLKLTIKNLEQTVEKFEEQQKSLEVRTSHKWSCNREREIERERERQRLTQPVAPGSRGDVGLDGGRDLVQEATGFRTR